MNAFFYLSCFSDGGLGDDTGAKKKKKRQKKKKKSGATEVAQDPLAKVYIIVIISRNEPYEALDKTH